MEKLSLVKKIELAPHSKSKVICKDGIERIIKNDTDYWKEIYPEDELKLCDFDLKISTNGSLII